MATLVSRPVLDAAAFVAVPSVMFGAIEVLVPLRIDELGGSHGADRRRLHRRRRRWRRCWRRWPGAISDRVGRRAALRRRALDLRGGDGRDRAGGDPRRRCSAALIVTSLGAGLCFAPALTLISDVAEASSLHQGFAAGLSNMAWASGQVIGGIGGGVVASLTGNAVPSIAIAAPAAGHRRLRLPGAAARRPSRSRRRARLGRWHGGAGRRAASGSTGPATSPAARRSMVRPARAATSWRRRSPPPRRPGGRSASPAPGTPSPRRR